GRTAALATGNPSAFQSIRRRLCARRALRRTSSRGHRGAVDGARPIESLRQFAVRGRTRDRCDPACGLGCRRRAGRRRTRWPCALQRSAARVRAGRAIANQPLSVRRLHCAKPNAALAQGRVAAAWSQSQHLLELDVDFPLGVFTTVTGVSGSGKSSLVSQVLVELVAKQLGHPLPSIDDEGDELERAVVTTLGGRIASGMEDVKRLVV